MKMKKSALLVGLVVGLFSLVGSVLLFAIAALAWDFSVFNINNQGRYIFPAVFGGGFLVLFCFLELTEGTAGDPRKKGGGWKMNQRFYILLWVPVLILLDYFEANFFTALAITCAGVYEVVLRHSLNARMTAWMLIAFFQMAGFMLVLKMPPEVFWFVVLVVVSNDVCAYFGGKYFSKASPLKTNPFPAISPKKTIGGYLYGLAGGIAAGLVIAQLLDARLFAGWSGIWFATGFCLVGNAGDLVASKFKRVHGLKDSGEGMITGKLLAGHGGVYDRFDALSAACWAWFIFINYVQ